MKYPDENPAIRALLEWLCQEVEAGRVVLPLTSTNIYETHKINMPKRRLDLAETQVTLSQGLVFRGRHKRLGVEITDVLRRANGLPLLDRDPRWFLSDVFLEAFLEIGDSRLGMTIPDTFVDLVRAAPASALFEYLAGATDNERSVAVSQFSAGSEQLRQRIEERRARHANEPVSVRRDIHNVLMMHGEIDLIRAIAAQAGIAGKNTDDLVRDNARSIMDESPTYLIEREIALRIEAQTTRKIEENDFRDMQAFSAVVAYADVVVAENMFSSLAKQAALHKQFNTEIITNILGVRDCL